MKKIALILVAIGTLFMSSCQNPAKSRSYMDEGDKLMMRYSNFEGAEEAYTKAIKYDKANYEAYYMRGCAKTNSRKSLSEPSRITNAIIHNMFSNASNALKHSNLRMKTSKSKLLT